MIRLICEPLQKLCKKAKFLTFIYTLYYLCHVALSSDAALLLFVFTFYHVVHPREYPETERHIVTRTHLRFTAQHGENIRILRTERGAGDE